MAVLVLDSEAVSALAILDRIVTETSGPGRAMRSAHRRNAPVRIPSVVLVELYRGRSVDEPIDARLARGFAQVVTTGARMAQIAGHLLSEAGARSEMAVDAFVVATAIGYAGASS